MSPKADQVESILRGEGDAIVAGLLYAPQLSAQDIAMAGRAVGELAHRGYSRVPARYANAGGQFLLATDSFTAPVDGPAWVFTHIAVFTSAGELMVVYPFDGVVEMGGSFALSVLPQLLAP